MTTLRPLRDDDFPAWSETSRAAYAHSIERDHTRRRGLGQIELNVFTGNEVARGLYRSLGSDEVAVYMGKDVA